ncbi:MAG: phosphoribosylformylglycinamidine synthase [Pseudoflavonifractor sp.]|nr:phosphoribosylformylglycinamidine synthase [Alloprevotella sp.]MCM1116009.1 phosphoribosylformylglycinamidine synthase [Pseudoflavonifractor sp.]
MVVFFKKGGPRVIAVATDHSFSSQEEEKLSWLFDGARPVQAPIVSGRFIGPRKEMITPWSTNAVEITRNMGLEGIDRIEEFMFTEEVEPEFDRMLRCFYPDGLDQEVFTLSREPEPVVHISDIHEYNLKEGLALSPDEEQYLSALAEKLGRPLTDSEVFGFSQVNSEHCRHKIFNGTFVIDGEEKPESLFKLIKKTSQENPGKLVSAYKDNVAFVEGPQIEQFAPTDSSEPSLFEVKAIDSVLSLKAETHNFPTTVEPFNGAATGSGGEIRDRLGGGKASLPLAGTAVYMTSYPRMTPSRRWELMTNPRVWLYQTPSDILIKASNGASDFGNKFGQPLICGSVLTFEHDENGRLYAYDKVIMLAGGVGFANKRDAIKGIPEPGQAVVVMGGDNYRIGMGGGAVSSVATGQYAGSIELNAVQRANPEMQKRVANVIRALAEDGCNPIVSIHDHGAGGHLNALSELVEATGGHIDMKALPVGDPTLSAKEVIGNESQERMGMVVNEADLPRIKAIADRERAPMFVVGHTTDDDRFVFEQADGSRPIDLAMADMFGNSPKTVMTDSTVNVKYLPVATDSSSIHEYIEAVLSLEAVACKDWLTNKVDRSITGKIARQQCQGDIQLPVADCGVVALDYRGRAGIATSIGHAPQVALIDPAAGSVMAIAEALTNIVGAPLTDGLKSISLSANWMWPCKNPGEDAALYRAVKACSDFACALGINIPTGKDSLSMTQKYGDDKVFAPGTVIISAAGEVTDVRRSVPAVVSRRAASRLYYIDFSGMPLSLGGSALAQTMGRLGDSCPSVASATQFAATFNAVQSLVERGAILSAHDVSAGGLLTTLLEMCFPNNVGGMTICLDGFAEAGETDIVKVLFAENPALVVQIPDSRHKGAIKFLRYAGVKVFEIGRTQGSREIEVTMGEERHIFDVNALRDTWYYPSYLMDTLQCGSDLAAERMANYKKQPLRYRIADTFIGSFSSRHITPSSRKPSGIRAAIIREKGVNGDREMAFSLYLAGFDVKDVHMSDLMSGRETLEDVNMLVFCGGFSHSDVLGSAKGWASGFVWNDNARRALMNYYNRRDTLSLGVCNGCQLMVELGLIDRSGILFDTDSRSIHMAHNDSHKFESAFLGVEVQDSPSVMLAPLAGTKAGIWVAHGEGKFHLPNSSDAYCVALRYSYSGYPGNPNGSRGSVAGICSPDGRHLAMMPHLERAIFPWQCAVYPSDRRSDDVTPWIDAFINARKWIESKL